MGITEEQWASLIAAARDVRTRAHAPYSNYFVGAALLGQDGKIYASGNVENAAYPTCLCAERGAVSAAVSAGNKTFLALVICTLPSEKSRVLGAPCGNCRQTLAEFGMQLPIRLVAPQGAQEENLLLADLLPRNFSDEDFNP